MEMQTMNIEQEIRSFLQENFLVGGNQPLTDEQSLLGNVIDSNGVIELVMFLQERFDITVEDEEVNTDNLDSVRNAVNFVGRKLRAKSAIAVSARAK